ncbi:uncharacterized protein NP_1852A [Natronomonas pharaonis DSM 2160]|uniref:DUF1109 domain-containing protein n=1 Tax=Natronomonas pharaonis (strain ATCC 35678 / DSM 2160 / CIP 103997 / JCM 8858 / NBRC 14720 / NCIMB 2260 / Gabara) TaxID=348780 RepID=A0A1U7EVH0_NATPD|nr:hypothetical protein [Natronomonas pharaonis]CAI49017.2 uncharacterized protein NP_1852A [Natronomonas pharaonis DSM 2160]
MNFNIDGGKLLYVLGVLFAFAALLYFVSDVVFGLSITVTALLLFVAFVAFLVAGLAIDRDALDVVAYAISGLSYAVFLGYVTARYGLGETGIFLLLAASAGLFVGLGYGVRQQSLDIDRRTAAYVAVVLVAVGVVFIGADLATGDVEYTVEMQDETTISVTDEHVERDRPRVTADLWTVTATNPSPFTRPVDLPSARGCLSGVAEFGDETFPVRYEPRSFGTPDRLDGGAERTHTLTGSVPVVADDPGERTYAVERAESCDVSHDEPTIVVVFEDDTAVAV